MKRRRIPFSSLFLIATTAIIVVSPDTGHAAPLRETIFSTAANIQLWGFFRSLINWGLVAFLIFIAFSNVTRFKIDSYAVKKTLPGLIVGFILANASLQICRLVIDIGDSLAVTAIEVGYQAIGQSIFNAMFGNFWTGGITALIGVVLAVGIFSQGFGIIPGLVAIFFVMLFPLVILLLLNLMFIIRGYVITLLVVISPLAFIAMGTPFTQKWFSKWWGYLTLWVFMKPIGFFLLSFGAIIMNAGVPNTAVAYMLGLASMVGAITIPWKSGGWINQAVAKYGKQFGTRGATATGGLLNTAGEKLGAGAALGSWQERWGNRLKAAGKASKAAPYLKGQVEERLEKDAKRREHEGKAAAASVLGDNKKVQALFQESVEEEKKKIGDDENEVLLVDRLEKAKSVEEKTAILAKAHDSKLNHKFYKEIYKRGNLVAKLGLTAEAAEGDTDENRSRSNVKIMGGSVDADGTVADGLAKRQNRLFAQKAKSNGFSGQANSLDSEGNIRRQSTAVGTPGTPGHRESIDEVASESFGGTATDIGSKASADTWKGRVGNTDPNAGFSRAWQIAASKGKFNAFIDNTRALENLDGFTAGPLAEVDRGQLQAQLDALTRQTPVLTTAETNDPTTGAIIPAGTPIHPMGTQQDPYGTLRKNRLLDQIYKSK